MFLAFDAKPTDESAHQCRHSFCEFSSLAKLKAAFVCVGDYVAAYAVAVERYDASTVVSHVFRAPVTYSVIKVCCVLSCNLDTSQTNPNCFRCSK